MATYDALIKNREQLTRDEETVLLEKAQNGDKEAREELISSNISLVGYMIRFLGVSGLAEEEDLFEEGLFGLIKAVDKFKIQTEVRFATYACKVIKSYVLRFVGSENKLLYHSYNVRQCAITMKKEVTLFYMMNGKEPSSLKDLNQKKLRRYSESTLNEAWELLHEESTSLDAPVGSEEDNSPLQDFVPNGEDFEEDVAKNDIRERLITAVRDALPERDADILLYKYGFFDGEEKTLEKAGERYGVTRERVRQIEEKALPVIKECFQTQKKRKAKGKDKFVLTNPLRLKTAKTEAKTKYTRSEHNKKLEEYKRYSKCF